jgi:hypothetical protein
MPGTYAHLTLVNELRVPARLDAIPDFPDAAKAALMRHFKFCELGAVSPDYPYLAILDSKAAQWADLMHYEHTVDMIGIGVQQVAAMPDGPGRERALSWLLGYAAHVVTDVTIHPVIELKVGPYAENKRQHRVCELHQDAYIFPRLNVGRVGLAEYLNSGIWACCDQPGSGRLDPVIAQLWRDMMLLAHGDAYLANPPDPDHWHRAFRGVVDKIEEGGCLMPAARHLAVDCGLTYPNPEEVDKQYIENLRVPGLAGHMHYDAIFAQAIGMVSAMWSWIARGVYDNNPVDLALLGNWNLDTGRDEANHYVMWS